MPLIVCVMTVTGSPARVSVSREPFDPWVGSIARRPLEPEPRAMEKVSTPAFQARSANDEPGQHLAGRDDRDTARHGGVDDGVLSRVVPVVGVHVGGDDAVVPGR